MAEMNDGEPKVVRVRLTVTQAEARRLSRVARWERASADVCLPLGPITRPTPTPACVLCDDKPAPENNPCGGCGKTALTPADQGDLVERVGIALWRNEAERAAPNVAKMRNAETWLSELSGQERERLRYAARAAIATLPDHAAELAAKDAVIAQLRAERDTPETADWAKGVLLEANHQRARWGTDHDAGKSPLDWFWLIGYLAQKAADAHARGDMDKAAHHTISTSAALANWHLSITGIDNSMRPGIDPRVIAQAARGHGPLTTALANAKAARP